MRQTLRALASVVGLVAAVAGLPAMLVGIVGWPLPHGLPAGSEIRSALGDGWRPGERFVLGVLALVLWVLWAQLLRHLAAEVRLYRRAGAGRPLVDTDTSPGRGPSRRLAGWLVSGFMLAGPLTTAAVASTPAIPVMLHTTRALDIPSATAPAPAATTPAKVAVSTPEPSYVVHTWEESRDCLWTIAGRFVGDPLRWGELLELNAEVRQPDGRRLADDPRHWVYPGMQLRLPAGAAGEGVSAASPAEELAAADATAPDLVVPEPPAAGATTAPGSRPHQQSAAATPLGLPVPPAPRPHTAAASSNGSGVVVPTTVAPSTPATPTPLTPEPSPPAGHQAAPANAEGASGGVRVNGANLLGAGLLAAGVVATLDRMRRAQLRRRRPGQRIALPGPQTAGREWAARVGADREAVELLDLGLRAMAAGLAGAGDEPPEILGVELGDDRLEVVLATPASAPAGFVVDGDRWVLVASTSAELEWAAETPQPLPALVSVGHFEGGTQVLVDLEQAGLTAIAGDPEAAREMVWAAAVELANKDDATLFSLVLVGFGDGLAGLERVQVVDSLTDAIGPLEREAAEYGAGLASEGWRSMLHARVATAMPDCWAPTVVLCADPPPPAELDRLTALTTWPGMAGVVALVAGEVTGARRQLLVVDGLLEVAPLGLRLSPQRLSAEEAAAIGELYAVARRQEPARPGSESDPVGGEAVNGWAPTPAPFLEAPDDDSDSFSPEDIEAEVVGPEPGDVGMEMAPAAGRPRALVRVLGPVEVEVGGVTVAFERPKAKEAVAYLATHRHVVVDGDRLGEALFPSYDGRPTKLLNTTMWAARKGLGAEDGDSVYLPKLRGSQRLYGIEQTDLDYDRVVEANRLAAADPGARSALREALAEVRGTPFEPGPTKGNARNRKALDRDGLQWAHVDGLIYEMSAGVADAAHRLVGLCLDDGDWEGARWAAAQGLKASPHNEVLCRDQMLVADASGNVAGVDAVWDELCVWMDEDQPCDSLDPETVALHAQLRR